MNADRRLRNGEFPLGQLLLAWAAVCAILLLTNAARIASGRFPDPDDVLRLIQVRDLLAGQDWFDLTQYRIDPPNGTVMHWARLADLPVFLVIAALAPLIGQPAAETTALFLVPPLTFLIAALAIGRLAWRLFDARVAIFTVLACGFLPPMLFQFQPMRIDHHGWQIASVAVALWAISRRNARLNGAIAGVAMAFGVSISIEILPIAAAFGLVLFARWWFDHQRRTWLVAYLLALALGLTGFYLGTRGPSLIAYCDAVSPAHLAFFLVAAAGTWLIAQTVRLRGFGLLLLFAGVGGAAAASFLAISPQCVASPFAILDPAVDRYWYRLVMEGQPLWKQEAAAWVPALIQLGAALGVVLVLRQRSMDWVRGWWGEYLVLLLASIALGLLVARSIAFASIIAALPLGWLASTLLLRLRKPGAPLAALGTLVAMIVLLAPMSLVMAARAIIPSEEPAATSVASSSCDIYANASRFRALDTGTIFAPLDMGPAILFETDHKVVATGHHRAADAMAQVIGAFMTEPGEARAIITSRDADYLALCTDIAEARIYANEAPAGLAAQIMAGDQPDWLEKVELGGPPELLVFRVKR